MGSLLIAFTVILHARLVVINGLPKNLNSHDSPANVIILAALLQSGA